MIFNSMWKLVILLRKQIIFHASVGFIDHINIPAEIHLAIFAAL